jgi:hypothetical protein
MLYNVGFVSNLFEYFPTPVILFVETARKIVLLKNVKFQDEIEYAEPEIMAQYKQNYGSFYTGLTQVCIAFTVHTKLIVSSLGLVLKDVYIELNTLILEIKMRRI